MGKLIVFEGLDGSGKATQAKLFHHSLLAQGQRAINVTFPNYNSPSSALVKMYLSGEMGKRVTDVNAYSASLFFGVDRFASFKTQWGEFYSTDGIVISDRYTTSNAVHQCSKMPQKKWDEFLNWLFTTEYELMAIPKPDIVFYLDVDPEVSQDLMTNRYKGTDKEKDIHERDLNYLKQSRKAAKYCVKKYNWSVIKCSENGKMRTIDDIHFEITKKYSKLLQDNF